MPLAPHAVCTHGRTPFAPLPADRSAARLPAWLLSPDGLTLPPQLAPDGHTLLALHAVVPHGRMPFAPLPDGWLFALPPANPGCDGEGKSP
ncbi:hypothetical protein U9M48_002966 [Paspalum notatum var. saurae]|uniref:Uncharacterized protein n=1 Tax=Paspalum notatum var. saurae TaxID=547442 RepID=A0AAQ3SDS7_PASNO